VGDANAVEARHDGYSRIGSRISGRFFTLLNRIPGSAAFDCFAYSSIPSATTLVKAGDVIIEEPETVAGNELQIRGWRSL